jgi:hypothetical protein
LEEAEAKRVADEMKRKLQEQPQIIKQVKVMKYDEEHECDKTVAFIEEKKIDEQVYHLERTEIQMS